MRTTLLTSALVLANLGTAHAAVIGPRVDGPTGSSYYLITADNPASSISWTEAQKEAEALGGNLVTINNAEENEFVRSTYWRPENLLWIGLNDVEQEGLFSWVSGEPLSFTNWDPNEPNSSGPGEEDYVHMWGSGEWNDLADSGSLGITVGVAEVTLAAPVPVPAAVWLLGSALALMMGGVRQRV